MKKLFYKINNISKTSLLFIKIGMVISIGYFTFSIIYQLTNGYSNSIIENVNNINTFFQLGIFNFIFSIILGLILNYKLKSTNNCEI